MISIVIRNKNEAESLENILSILFKIYVEDIAEVIIVDNYSTDSSVKIAEKYNCRVVFIKEFTYGKATNVGIETAKSDYVLLLSSHAIPIGNSFFKNTMKALNTIENVAGIRYINSMENYKRAFKNNFKVTDPLHNGLMTGCAMVNKKIWTEFKFDEKLPFSEDKEWSKRVVDNGYHILDLNETFFYFIKRDRKSQILRFKNETLAYYLLNKKNYPNLINVIASFLKKIIFTNTKVYFKSLIFDILILKSKIEIYSKLKNRL